MAIAERGESKIFKREHPTRFTTTYLVYELGPNETIGELRDRAKLNEYKSEGWRLTVHDLTSGYVGTIRATIQTHTNTDMK